MARSTTPDDPAPAGSPAVIGEVTASAPVLVVGAGPAGLAAARELAVRRIPYRVLERGPAAGHVWRNLYDSLTLHTGRHLSALPGLRFPRGTPLFPTRDDFVAYLDSYRDTFDIRIDTGVEVLSATSRNGAGWAVETSAGRLDARALVVATGIVSEPVVPTFAAQDRFAGRIIHSVEYRRPDQFGGRRVLVVGCGNSGGEIASELAEHGAVVTIAVRTGANVVPLSLAGVPIQYVAWALRGLPAPAKKLVVGLIGSLTQLRRGPPVLPQPPWGPLERVPLIGFHLADAIRRGHVHVMPGIERFTELGVRFTDSAEAEFDDVILATGFRPAIGFLDGSIRTDASGFALRSDRVTSADRRGLFFVGHNYDSTGGLLNISRDAPIAAGRIAAG